MSEIRLDVYLLGEPQPGIDRSTLVRNLAATFKKEVPVIEKMLRQSRSLLKANIDSATAEKYQNAIKKAGGKSELVNHGEQLFPREALSPVAARAPLTVAPVEPTLLTPVEDQAPTFSGINNAHTHSPYTAPNSSSESTAEILGLSKRGKLEVGNFADIIIFDPLEVQDKATFESPEQFATGIDYVIVNEFQLIQFRHQVNEQISKHSPFLLRRVE